MFYNKSIAQIESELKTSSDHGLTSAEAQKRQQEFGYNELTQKESSPWIVRFLAQFKDTLIIILLIAAAVSVLVEPEEWIDSVIILLVVVVNALLGIMQESKAEKALEALKKMSSPTAKVIRNGQKAVIDAREVVVGDILLLEAGDSVASDARILEAHNLKVDESALTGESLPVSKHSNVIDADDVALGDRLNMVFQSCNITYGRGIALVTAIGMDNEVGKIAEMLMQGKQELTPLQIKLNQIGKSIGMLCIGVCVIVFGMEWLAGRDMIDAFKTSVALAVAAIPEGLATVVTIVLAMSVQRMVKENAIIRRLPAVETLGSTSIVCSDKTGTLTQNKMTVVKTFMPHTGIVAFDDANDEETLRMLNYFTLGSDAEVIVENGVRKEIGDPTETALVVASAKKGFHKDDLLKRYKRIGELSFDSDRKMMTVFYEKDGKIISITKGGPDVILSRSNHVESKEIMTFNDTMAKDALRVLGVATRTWDAMPEEITSELVETDMTFIGLVGMIDPARPEVKGAISLAKQAGVRTIMITGDHITTATAIAKELGILNGDERAITGNELNLLSQEELQKDIESYSVYARVAPEHKVRIVNAWQAKGHVVAMTGDGVNDSPALKSADIGCAMGITGTDVAKGAAAMILTDDNFATIITSIREGRGIYDNIKKVVQYLLASNIGEVLTIFGASLASVLYPHANIGVPLLPIHLLWVNLITDSLPAFALGVEPTESDVMERSPRAKNESFFSDGLTFTIVWQGIMVGGLTLFSYFLGQQVNHDYGMTMAFITLSAAQLFHSFNVKSHHSILNKSLFNNKALWGAAIVGALMQLMIIFIPPLAKIFKLIPLDFTHFAMAVGLAASTIIISEITKLFIKVTRK